MKCPVCGEEFSYLNYHLVRVHRKYYLEKRIEKLKEEIKQLEKELSNIANVCEHKEIKRVGSKSFWKCTQCSTKFKLVRMKE